MTPLERIYPQPRVVRTLPGGGGLRNVMRAPIVQASMEHAGAYSLRFDGHQLRAQAADSDGEHSVQSVLRQLSLTEGSDCPAFELTDWPRFATRGFMLDISRNRVPTMAALRELVDALSMLRMNHLQLYTEHAFAYSGHETVWCDASPVTPDEIREIDKLCRDRGIELAANQNCFGHLSEWLRHPAYADLAETHGPYDFYGMTRDGPFSLCPTDDRSLELVHDWIGQLGSCFSSPLLNIGCDETADVGSGRSRQTVAERGKSAVYADFVRSVADIAAEHGFAPMFWADIALDSPGTLDLLPANLKPLAWGYEPDSPFDAWDKALRDAGRTGWVCPGTSCWRSFFGRTTERRGNLEAACATSDTFDGMLVTAWGDVGHQQQWPITLHALADAAHAAWHGTPNPDAARSSRVLFGSHALGPWLDELGEVDRHVRSPKGGSVDSDGLPRLLNASAVFNEIYPANAALSPRGTLGDWRQCAAELDQLAATQPETEPLIDSELRWTLSMSMVACRLAIQRHSGERDDALANELRACRETYRDLWARRSRPGGLDRSIEHIDRLITACDGVQR